MTELDFDELDKAVSSLMSDRDITAQVIPTDGPIAPISAPSVSPSLDPAPTIAPSPAVRRRGQFMDMVHPSSNMRSTPISAPVRQQAAVIMPLAASDAHETLNQSDSVDSYPAVTPVETPTESAAPASSEWPDPIDMATPAMSDTPVNNVTADTDTPPQDLSSLLVMDDPQTSPFLPDTKVQKRPLGSPLPAAEPVLLDASAEPSFDVGSLTNDQAAVSDAQTPDVETSEARTVEETSMPRELDKDVAAVEANEVIRDEPSSQEVAPEAQVTPVVALDVPQSAGGVIVPQYQEQPSTGDQTNGPIYDTNTYHQPLDAKPAKKKSAVLTWVLWVLVLLIIGATAGAAWFYFTTQ